MAENTADSSFDASRRTEHLVETADEPDRDDAQTDDEPEREPDDPDAGPWAKTSSGDGDL
jgi:hypothetical protein